MLQSCFATRIQSFGRLRSSFAVNSKGAKVVALGYLRLPPMGSTTLRSKSSALPSSESDGSPNPSLNQKLKVDSEEVQKLTVQQLRQKLRSVGLSANGLKGDLVSAWKNFLNSQIDEDQVPSQPMLVETKEKRKSGDLCGSENVSDKPGLEISQSKRTKRKVIEVLAGDGSVGVKEIQSDSVDFSESGGKKSILKKKKTSIEITCKQVEESQSLYSSGKPWMVLAHKKPEKDWVVYNPRTMRSPPLTGDAEQVKVMSWNVNGLRALLKLQSFSALELAQRENFDVLCFQETKLQEKDVEAVKQTLIEGYDNSFWTCSVAKLGYSGTAIISRIKPLSVRYGIGISDHDSEGRLVTAEFDKFFLLCAYVPNSGDGLKRLSYRTTEWDTSLSNYMKELEKQKPVILTGDLNCAHEEIDIHDPSGNKRSAGFTAEERQSFESNFLNKGFVDTFRRQHPGVVGYTYWGYRHDGRKKNRGWRLDYFLVSESIADKIHDSFILPDVLGSDHCPIGLVAKL